MNPFDNIHRLHEVRENIYEIYRSVSMELEGVEKETMIRETNERINPLKEEIRKRIFILLCQGYFTDSIEEDDFFNTYTFTDEEIEMIYNKPLESYYPLLRSLATGNNPVSNSYPHPRTIQLSRIQTGYFGMGAGAGGVDNSETKIDRMKALERERIYLNVFVNLFLIRWNIGINRRTGDIELVEPPEKEYKLFYEITQIQNYLKNVS